MIPIRTTFYLAVAVIIGGLVPSSAKAVMTFTDVASFNAVAGSMLTDDYNDFTSFTFPSFPFDRGAYEIDKVGNGSIAAAPGGIPADVNGTGFLVIGGVPFFNEMLNEGIFTFDEPISAFGFDYRTQGTFDGRLRVSGGGFSTDITATSPVQFLGIVFDSPVTEVRLLALGDNIVSIDNLRTTSAASVPEPAGAMLALLGIGASVMRRRRTILPNT